MVLTFTTCYRSLVLLTTVTIVSMTRTVAIVLMTVTICLHIMQNII